MASRRCRALQTTPGPRDADIDGRLGLAGAHVGPGHEGVVLGDVGEDDQLGAAEAAPVGRGLRRSSAGSWPIWWTASMLMPALREATLTDAHTRAGLREHLAAATPITTASAGVMPLCTRAVKPPTKSTRHSAAAASSVLATCTAAAWPWPGQQRARPARSPAAC